MKTVLINGVPTRQSDETAAKTVDEGKGTYCPKHVYKDATKKKVADGKK